MKALKELRRAAGLSQRELAAALGVTATAVNKWELGRSWPAAPMLPRLAALLGCQIEELYAEPEEERPDQGIRPYAEDLRAVEGAGPYTVNYNREDCI